MIGDERDNLRVNAWIRGGKKNGFFVRPRLFMPYYEEIKVIIIVQSFQNKKYIYDTGILTSIIFI